MSEGQEGLIGHTSKSEAGNGLVPLQDGGARFQVVPYSMSSHFCCFGFTVVDTTKPESIGSTLTGNYEQVCECLDGRDADRIAAALNKESGGTDE